MSPSRAQSRGGGGKNHRTKCHFPSPAPTLGFDLSGARDEAVKGELQILCHCVKLSSMRHRISIHTLHLSVLDNRQLFKSVYFVRDLNATFYLPMKRFEGWDNEKGKSNPL